MERVVHLHFYHDDVSQSTLVSIAVYNPICVNQPKGEEEENGEQPRRRRGMEGQKKNIPSEKIWIWTNFRNNTDWM